MSNEFVARNGVIAQNDSIITGSLTVTAGITGSLFGTSSWAQNSLTASLLLGSVTSASYASTASLLLGSISSASYATTALNVLGGASNYIPFFSGSTNLSSSVIYQSGSNIGINVLNPTYDLQVSGSSNVVNFRGSGSASTSSIFTVDGAVGRLFSVDDSLSGSLFSVNTIAGLPIMEAFSDNTIRIGQYGQKALFISQSSVGIGKESELNTILDVSGSVTITGSLEIAGGLEVTSTTSGFLAPRMTSTQRNAIVSPSIGLVIYQTDGTEGLYQYTSTGWTAIGSGGGGGGGSSAASSLFNYYNFI